MFGKKKKSTTVSYEPATMKPVLYCSICNGEKVFGFKNSVTGEFTEISLIRNDAELNKYLKMYGLETVEKIY